MEVATRLGCAVVVLTLSACSSQPGMDSERITRFDKRDGRPMSAAEVPLSVMFR